MEGLIIRFLLTGALAAPGIGLPFGKVRKIRMAANNVSGINLQIHVRL